MSLLTREPTCAHQCPFLSSLFQPCNLSSSHLISSPPGRGPLCSCCPRPPCPPPLCLFFATGQSLPTYLGRSHPMSRESVWSEHQWGQFFICIKLFKKVCQVALSVSPGLQEARNSPERESSTGGGSPVHNPNPTLKKVVGESTFYFFFIIIIFLPQFSPS